MCLLVVVLVVVVLAGAQGIPDARAVRFRQLKADTEVRWQPGRAGPLTDTSRS